MSFAERALNSLTIAPYLNGGDTKHTCLYNEFGYPIDVTYELTRRAYERIGIARGGIHFLHDKAFESNPEIFEGDDKDEDKKEDTPLEKQFKLFAKRTKLWRNYKTACIRRSVGAYSALIIKIADGKMWQDKAEGIRPDKIGGFIPCWQNQLIPSKWESDPQSMDYGKPLQFTYFEYDPQAAKLNYGTPARGLTIDASRVIWFGDILGNGSEAEEGTMLLRSGFNSLIDWQKIRGSGAEGFYKNAARHLSISFNGDIQPEQIFSMAGCENAEEFAEYLNDVSKDVNNNFDVVLSLMGAQVSVLSTNLPSSDPFSEVALKDFAASMNLSAKGIVGSQTGERASSEDSIMDNKTATSYRENTLDYEIEKIITHLQSIGSFTEFKGFGVKWDSLLDASDNEKLEIAERMAKVNAALIATGEAVFSNPEIRIAAGYEGEPEEEIAVKPVSDIPVEERLDVEI